MAVRDNDPGLDANPDEPAMMEGTVVPLRLPVRLSEPILLGRDDGTTEFEPRDIEFDAKGVGVVAEFSGDETTLEETVWSCERLPDCTLPLLLRVPPETRLAAGADEPMLCPAETLPDIEGGDEPMSGEPELCPVTTAVKDGAPL